MKKRWGYRIGFLIIAVGLLILAAGSAYPAISAGAGAGDTVSLHYTLTLDDGEVYYSSLDGAPQKFQLGKGMLLQGFESAVTGMRVGESKTVTLPFMDAYGPHQEALILEVDKSELPEGTEPVVGQQLQADSQGGNPMMLIITKITGSKVTLDANHPLAGRDLTFHIQVVGLEK